ncbi:MAG: Laminin G domain protein [archaeon ADurb.Bin336]|nr:MAG: Laminin G domain protein [archaeon ADurb.Bin336]
MKKIFFRKSKAQSTIESILIVAMALFILTALFGITYDQIYSFRADQSRKTASVAINSIVKEVNDVYFLGPGAMKTIIVRLPEGIDFNKSFIKNRTICLNVFGSDVFSTASVDLRGVWPGDDGTFSFTLTAYDDYVSISIRPVDVSPNSVSEYLVQGESKDFSVTLHNSSDEDKSYSMVIDFPSSEVSLSSTHEGVVEVFYDDSKVVNYSISCGSNSFGSYSGKIVFVPLNSSDENITIPINLFCSSLQTKLKVYPSTKYFYTTAGSITSDSVLVCNTTSRDFSSSSTSVSGSIAPYVITSFSEPVLANSCSNLNFVINAPSVASNYLGSLRVDSGGYSSVVDLSLLTYYSSDAINISWDEAYFGEDGKSINDINLTVLVGPFDITHAAVLFLNDIDDANVIGLYLNESNKLSSGSKLSSGEWGSVSDFNLARRKSYDLDIVFDANILNDSEKFRIVLKGSDGTYFWSPIFDPTNLIVDNNVSHFSNSSKGTEPIYPKSENLIGLWRFNDKNSDGWVFNSVKESRDGKLFNGADVNEIGHWDTNAIYFDGVNDYVSLDIIPSLSDRYTMSAWIYPTRATPANENYGNTIFATSSGYGVWLLHNNGKIRAYSFTNSTSDYSQTTENYVELNKWQHIAITAIKNGGARVYYNGELVLSFTASNSANMGGVLGIGDLRLNRGLTYKGLIDDVAIWNTALTEEDVREIYSIGSGVRNFGTQVDENGLYLSRGVDGNFVSDGNFYSRVFDFNGGVNFSQLFFNQISYPPYLFFSDNNLNNDYSLNSSIYKRSDNSFTPTGELDSNILDKGSELNSSNILFDSNLIGLWHFNDKNSNGWLLNSATGVRDAVLSGDANVSGIGLWDSNAGFFGGVNGHVKCGNFGSFPSQGTISFWMNPSVVENYRNPLTTNYLGFNSGIRFEENSSGNFAVVVGNDAGNYDAATYITSGMKANNWYHIVYSWNRVSNTEQGYLNGIMVFSNSHNLWPTSIPNFTIGNGFDSSRYWKGGIEEVAIWDRALSSSEVNNLYVSQKGNWVDSNLVGYWKFNSANGTTVLDYARSNNGTLVGSGASVNHAGLWDSTSFYGNGSSYYVNIPHTPTLKSTSFTFSVWINFITSQSARTIMGYHNSNNTGASIGIDNSTPNVIKFHTNSYDTVLKSTTALNDGRWHQVVGTYSNGTSKLYVDGVLNNSRTGVPDPTLNTNAFQIGKWAGGSQYFLGYIDEVKVYNRVLSDEEIALDYNRALGSKFTNLDAVDSSSSFEWNSVKVNSDVNYSFGKEIDVNEKFGEGLVGLWHFNNNAIDSSGKGFNGTWVGSAEYSGGLWDTNSTVFNGSTTRVSVPRINTGAGTGVTGCGWVKRTGDLNMLSALFSFVNFRIRFYPDGRIYDRAFNYTGGSSSEYTSYKSVPVNKWTLVCVSYSSTGSNITMNFYFDGVLDRSIVTNASGLVGINNGGFIGADTDGPALRTFLGYIDEVAIWNRKLSDLEISELYRKGISRLDLNVYTCSDANCNTKTSSKYFTNIKNGDWLDFDSSLENSQYLGYELFFKKASGFEDFNAKDYFIGPFIKNIEFYLSTGKIDLFARTSSNGFSWGDWSSALNSFQNDLSLFDGNYFQYKSSISSTSPSYSPILKDVNVSYNRMSN